MPRLVNILAHKALLLIYGEGGWSADWMPVSNVPARGAGPAPAALTHGHILFGSGRDALPESLVKDNGRGRCHIQGFHRSPECDGESKISCLHSLAGHPLAFIPHDDRQSSPKIRLMRRNAAPR